MMISRKQERGIYLKPKRKCFHYFNAFNCITSTSFLPTSYDGLVEFTIAEIFDVSITTPDHIVKYGTYVPEHGEDVVFNNGDTSRMITVDASRGEMKSSHWVISLDYFLPFIFDPNFSLCQEKIF